MAGLAIIGVSTVVGCTELQRMWCGASMPCKPFGD
jgi:hypothetical protein